MTSFSDLSETDNPYPPRGQVPAISRASAMLSFSALSGAVNANQRKLERASSGWIFVAIFGADSRASSNGDVERSRRFSVNVTAGPSMGIYESRGRRHSRNGSWYRTDRFDPLSRELYYSSKGTRSFLGDIRAFDRSLPKPNEKGPCTCGAPVHGKACSRRVNSKRRRFTRLDDDRNRRSA